MEEWTQHTMLHSILMEGPAPQDGTPMIRINLTFRWIVFHHKYCAHYKQHTTPPPRWSRLPITNPPAGTYTAVMVGIGDQLEPLKHSAAHSATSPLLPIGTTSLPPTHELTLPPPVPANVAPPIKPSSKAALKPPPPKAAVAKMQAAPAILDEETIPDEDSQEQSQFDIPAIEPIPSKSSPTAASL